VSQFLVQPFLDDNLPKGRYLVSSPIITANWTRALRAQVQFLFPP
jgi:hypothetical protein